MPRLYRSSRPKTRDCVSLRDEDNSEDDLILFPKDPRALLSSLLGVVGESQLISSVLRRTPLKHASKQLGGKGAELLSNQGLMDHGDILSLYDRHLLQPSLTESIEVGCLP